MRVVNPIAPPKPILSVALLACVNPPVPARAVFTVRELLLVNVIMLIVTDGIAKLPVID